MVVTVALALHDYTYWSLVYGTISGALVSTVLLNALSGWRPGPPARKSGVRSMLKYGANITGFEVVNYFHRNLDNILIGRVWGSDALGLYNRAYQLLMFPITNLRTPINSVAFPALSQLQNQPEQFRLYYRKVTSLLAFATMPITAMMYVEAGPIINLALGEKWKDVVPLFSILAIVSFIQPAASLRGLVLQSLGQGRRYLMWGIINAVAVSIGFLIGIHWGAKGIAISYCISVYLILYPSMGYVFKGTPVSFVDFTQAIARPCAASLIAVLATMALMHMFPLAHASSLGQVCVFSSVFLVAYLVGFTALPGGRDELTKLVNLARTGFRKK
jgi:PST family polysaccharide transporter